MFNRIRSDFTTLTLVLIPVAMAINIVVGQVVQVYLKLPIYLDSVGTVLVAVLAGPLAGALTGFLSNIVLGAFLAPTFLPFSITALVIGLVAGLFARLGWFKRELPLVQGSLVVALVGLILIVMQVVGAPSPDAQLAAGGAALVLTLVALVMAALRVLPPLVAAAGLLTGVVAGLVSAPIASVVFGGVTGSGTDLLVAFFEAKGAGILQANILQGLVSDPFDKFISFLVVSAILRGLSRRYLARFPRASNVMDSR